MTLRDSLLPIFESARTLIQNFGLRQHRVFRVLAPWSAGQIHLGEVEPESLEILPRPKVEPNGDGGLKVSKITPEFTGGGFEPSDLLPDVEAGRDFYYLVRGPDGVDTPYQCVRIESHKNFGWTLYLRRFPGTEPGFEG